MPKMRWLAKDIPSKAKPIAKERTLWTFEGVRGLQLDCMPEGERIWKCRYQVWQGGKRIERKYRLGRLDPEAKRILGDTEQDAVLTPGQARDKAERILAQVASGHDPWHAERIPKREQSAAHETFDKLVNAWLDRHARVRNKSWTAYEGLYRRHIKQRLGSELVQSIDRQMIIAVLDDIAREISGLQANKCQTLISSVFSWALDEGKMAAHPALRIRKRGVDVRRDRVLTPDEMRRFWMALDDLPETVANVLRLLVLLGARLAEVAETERNELCLDDAAPSWTQPGRRVKNGVTHLVPLPPMAAHIFRSALCSSKGVAVFPAHRGGDNPISREHVSRTFARVATKLGIADARLHDLRHCCATGMAALGVSTDVRQRVMN